jgi:hypothetical protein
MTDRPITGPGCYDQHESHGITRIEGEIMDHAKNGFSIAIQGASHVYEERTKKAAQEAVTS